MIRASYSRTEIVKKVEELKHEPIRESFLLLNIDGGIEIASISNIPSRGTGQGSASSYTVGLLNALYANIGQDAGADKLESEAKQFEPERCQRVMGKQDQ